AATEPPAHPPPAPASPPSFCGERSRIVPSPRRSTSMRAGARRRPTSSAFPIPPPSGFLRPYPSSLRLPAPGLHPLGPQRKIVADERVERLGRAADRDRPLRQHVILRLR